MNNLTWFMARNEKRRNKIHFTQCNAYFTRLDSSRKAAFFAVIMPQMLLYYTYFSKDEPWQNVKLWENGLTVLTNFVHKETHDISNADKLQKSIINHIQPVDKSFNTATAIISVMASFRLAWSIEYLIHNTEEKLNTFFLGNLYEELDQYYTFIAHEITRKRPFVGWSEIERRREIALLVKLLNINKLQDNWQHDFQKWSVPLFNFK